MAYEYLNAIVAAVKKRAATSQIISREEVSQAEADLLKRARIRGIISEKTYVEDIIPGLEHISKIIDGFSFDPNVRAEGGDIYTKLILGKCDNHLRWREAALHVTGRCASVQAIDYNDGSHHCSYDEATRVYVYFDEEPLAQKVLLTQIVKLAAEGPVHPSNRKRPKTRAAKHATAA